MGELHEVQAPGEGGGTVESRRVVTAEGRASIEDRCVGFYEKGRRGCLQGKAYL